MCAIGLQSLRVVFAVAFYANNVHQVSPLLLKEVFSAFQGVEYLIARPGLEMVGIAVASPMKVECDLGVYAQGEIIV